MAFLKCVNLKNNVWFNFYLNSTVVKHQLPIFCTNYFVIDSDAFNDIVMTQMTSLFTHLISWEYNCNANGVVQAIKLSIVLDYTGKLK